MHIYKTYFRLVKSNFRPLLVYIGIFIVTMFLMTSQAKRNNETGFVATETSFAVFDYDNTVSSKQLVEFLSEHNKLVHLKKDEKETIQDAIYNRDVQCVLHIPQGFESNLQNGQLNDMVEVTGILNTTSVDFFERRLNGYIKTYQAYLISGDTPEQAFEHTMASNQITTDVQLLDTEKKDTYSSSYYYFVLCMYSFIGIGLDGLGPILLLFRKKDMKERIQCSAFRSSRFNSQIFLGILTIGAVIWAFFAGLGVVINGSEVLTIKGMLYLIQMFFILVVALSLGFMVCKFANKRHTLTMIANIGGLGMCFLCGIFVPLKYLGTNIVKVSRFLPAYWYALGCQEIDRYTCNDDILRILSCFGIEILFAVVFLAIGVAISRLNYKNK